MSLQYKSAKGSPVSKNLYIPTGNPENAANSACMSNPSGHPEIGYNELITSNKPVQSLKKALIDCVEDKKSNKRGNYTEQQSDGNRSEEK